MNLLEAALEYAEAGFPVFPLKPTLKSPIFDGGFKIATTNQKQIKEWWGKWPNANIGMPMGFVSGVVGLDLDYKDGCDPKILERLPKTVIQITTYKGHHAFFKNPECGIKNGKCIEKGATVRSDGYYFVMSPSYFIEDDPEKPKHEGGYSWDGRGLVDGVLEELPQWIIDCEGIKTGSKKAKDTPKGSRHEKLKLRAIHLRFIGKDESEILSDLTKINSEFPDGPKPEIEVLELVRWAMNTINPDVTDKDISPHDIAQKFLHDNGFINEEGMCLLRYYRQDFYRYKNNCYQKLDDEWVEDLLNRWLVDNGLKKIAGGNRVQSILKMLKTKPVYIGNQVETPCWIDNGHTEKRPWLIPLKNGIFNIKYYLETKEVELLAHTPQFFCTYVLPFEFNETAICNTYNSFIDDIFTCKETKDAINEMLGVHIYSPFLIEKFFVLVGEGSNGKSVLRTILTSLIGKDNVSTVGLECFNSNNFSFINSLGKLSNIIPDMKDISHVDEGVLKQFVSREPMIFNRKNKPAVQAEPTAFLTVCTNQLPKFTDKSKGIWRRITIFNFDKEIEAGAQNPKMRDPNFWEGELSGIFNLALAGVLRVIERGAIFETKRMKESVLEHQMDMNNVAQFLEECLDIEEDKKETTKIIYECYASYVKANGGKPLGSRQFFRQLKIEAKRKKAAIFVSDTSEWHNKKKFKMVMGCRASAYGRTYLYDEKSRNRDLELRNDDSASIGENA